ncbi:hypothetical protein THAOC_12397, partial [Thalassiosira oceanica]
MERWADGRQYSLEIKFDVDISSENYGRSKGILGSYTLNIDTGLNSFEEWDYFEVRSSEYANPGNGCSRRHSIPQITLYKCDPIHDKHDYGDRDSWIILRLLGDNWGGCLKVDSYGANEVMKQDDVCQDAEIPDNQKFVAFVRDSDNSKFALRPYGAVVNNKDVCFRPAGSFTRSEDCRDVDNYYHFSTESGSPGELELMVNFIPRQVRLIPAGEDLSHFRNRPESRGDRAVIFMSA